MDNISISQLTYIVLDFETVTVAGASPEPVELGAMRISPPGVIDPNFEFLSYIQPPSHMPHTIMDDRTEYRGIDFAQQPTVHQALQQFDRACGAEPFVAVAHNATYDASFIMRYAEACPHVAAMSFIDTVKLARHLLPALFSYRLDWVADHFELPIPLDRHRSLPDVRLTCEIFVRLLNLWHDEHQDQRFFLLKKVAGIDTASKPSQPSLFG